MFVEGAEEENPRGREKRDDDQEEEKEEENREEERVGKEERKREGRSRRKGRRRKNKTRMTRGEAKEGTRNERGIYNPTKKGKVEENVGAMEDTNELRKTFLMHAIQRRLMVPSIRRRLHNAFIRLCLRLHLHELMYFACVCTGITRLQTCIHAYTASVYVEIKALLIFNQPCI